MPYKDPEKAREYRREYRRKYYQANREKELEYGRKWREKNPEKVKEHSRKSRENNPEKRREYQRKYREKNLEKNREQTRKYNKKYKQDLRLPALEIYGGKCQFQAQTIVIDGVEYHFKSCADSWNDITIPEILAFHHIKGCGRKENHLAVYRRIIEHGIQADLQLLCSIHHELADRRDNTKYNKSKNNASEPKKDVGGLFQSLPEDFEKQAAEAIE